MTGSGIQGHVVIVLGGAGRIGEALCQRLQSEGGIPVSADVVLEERWPDSGPHNPSTEAYATVPVDVRDERSLARLIVSVSNRYGRIDAVVNSVYPRVAHEQGSPLSVADGELRRSLAEHQAAYYLVMRAFTSFFTQQGSGNVINLSSIYGIAPPRFELYEETSMLMPVDYALNKAAINSLTRYFAKYFRKSGIRFNAVAPGGLRADQNPEFVARYDSMCGAIGLLNPSDVVGVLMFLLSDDAKAITGQVIVVDDGWSL